MHTSGAAVWERTPAGAWTKARRVRPDAVIVRPSHAPGSWETRPPRAPTDNGRVAGSAARKADGRSPGAPPARSMTARFDAYSSRQSTGLICVIYQAALDKAIKLGALCERSCGRRSTAQSVGAR